MDGQPHAQFLKQVFGGAWMTQGIGVAAELGIADLLADGPRTAKEIAEQTQAHPAALYRVMRALASVGVFAQDDEGRFSLTPVSELLRSFVPGSQRHLGAMMAAEFHQAWGELLHSVRTGQAGFDRRFGMPFFEYMSERPDRHGIYDAAMGSFALSESGPVLDAYDFSPFQSLVDVGGGSGVFLSAILERHPGIRGTLFDLPSVADRTRAALADGPFDGRLRAEGGDFFESVPAGADAYTLQHIIHDWNDADAVAILRNCSRAMAPGGRVLVVEHVIPPRDQPNFGKWLDLMMLLVGGQERTLEEYRMLLAEAGLTLSRVVPTAGEVSVIEGVRAS